MALVRCPECRGKISEFAVTCPHCGLPYKEIPNPPRNKARVWAGRIGGLLALAALAALAVFLIWRAVPRPATPRLSDNERSVLDALVLALPSFPDPENVAVEKAGDFGYDDPGNPELATRVTLKIVSLDAAGETVTGYYFLTLAPYSTSKTLLSPAREYQKGDLEKTLLPIVSIDRDFDTELLNLALSEYLLAQRESA